MNPKEKELIKELVEKGDLDEALKSFDNFTSRNSMINNEVAQLKARYSINKKHEMQATLDTKEISIEKNKIAKSIIELLEFENRIKIKRYSYKKIGFIVILLIGSIASLYYFFSSFNEKIITGKIYTVEDGVEKPIQNCLIKIVNVSKGVSGKSDKYGLFNLLVEGKNIQELEFKLIHSEFEDLTQKIPINFRTLKDTIFSKEFELKIKEVSKSFEELRDELYRETSQVLGYLTSNTNFKSQDYKSKITRFWQLYNVELSAVETIEVEVQMVKIGKIISKINDDLEHNQFLFIKKELFNEAYALAQIFKKERS